MIAPTLKSVKEQSCTDYEYLVVDGASTDDTLRMVNEAGIAGTRIVLSLIHILLKIDFRVVSFDMVLFDQMGNAMSERSSGSNFSPRQREAMKQMRHGKRFYISRVKATGPDGVTRDIAPMEVIVN